MNILKTIKTGGTICGFALMACCLGGAGGDGCSSSSDDVQRDQQEILLKQATNSVGMPAITRWAERLQLKEILELRDKMPPTHTYMADLNGHLHKVCDSIGYGIPASTQFTSPQKVDSYAHSIVLPQADPNGLFSPSSSEGSWVLCLNPENNKISPLYAEPRLVVSQFIPMNVVKD